MLRDRTNLIARTINEHSSASIAVDPIVPFFSNYRDFLIRASGKPSLEQFIGKPINDYYFSHDQIRLLDLIISSDFCEKLTSSERSTLLAACASRSELDSGDLAHGIRHLKGSTFKEVLSNFFDLIQRRNKESFITHTGFKDLWVPEFIPVFEKSFPEALFIIVVRDIHAVLGSMVKLREKSPDLSAHTISYVRQWRKLVACLCHFEKRRGSQKILVVRYEDFISDPVSGVGSICDFLDWILRHGCLVNMVFKIRQLEINGSVTVVFDDHVSGITTNTLSRWQTVLDANDKAMIHLMCNHELDWLGYKSVKNELRLDAKSLASVWQSFVWNDKNPGKWRSDYDDLHTQFAYEIARHALPEICKNFSERGLR